ncbi:MAG: molybdopterin-dependent oxidoreductase, partial [Deltaproteobacteria bacterium]
GVDAVFPFVPSPLAADAIHDEQPYPLKALFCAGSNPVVNAQNCKRWWRAIKDHLDLFVVIDFVMTPSAELADFVLPAATWLEREEPCDLNYMGYVSARKKAIEPLYESRDELDILIDLVKRIPWAKRKSMPWDSVAECNDWMLAGAGMSFDELKEKSLVCVEPVYRKYLENGFDTPSGKVELYSADFERLGYPPVPDFKEPPQSPVSTPELMEEYPLVLISGAREINYFASEGRQIASLTKINADPLLEIHPRTAEELVNVILSGDAPRGETCASVATRGTLCKVYKAV